ncbi:MAG: pyridoxamine 5'-phosphate oxidase family protein [Clostridia bacterium]|nr:pyridoxamine 5'-phosphate oxidase family protein [Clostridia bacterium]
MCEKFPAAARKVMDERFSCDSLMALATVDGNQPFVRAVNAYYEDGCFYVVTHALSNKMKQIAKNPAVSLCGDWFTAQGTGENLGHVLLPGHADIMDKLRTVFAGWYGNGHVNEEDENTVLLRIRLTGGVLFSNGTRWEIDFT